MDQMGDVNYEISDWQITLLKGKFYWDEIWVWWSIITFPYLFGMYIYKLYYPINYRKYKKLRDMPKLPQDRILRIVINFPMIYYFVDTVLIVGGGLVWVYPCQIASVVHHIVSFSFLPLIPYTNYIPWWQLSVGVWHALLLWFPTQKWLNYVYLVGIWIFQFGLYTQPFGDWTWYKALRIGVWLLYISLIWMNLLNCNNSAQDYSVHPDILNLCQTCSQ